MPVNLDLMHLKLLGYQAKSWKFMPVNQEKNGGEIVLMQLFQDLCKNS